MCENETIKQVVLKAYRQLKLGNTLHTCKYRVDERFKNQANLGEQALDKLVRTEIAHVLAEQIVTQHRSAIKSESVNGVENFTEYGIQLIVLNPADFKIVVEAVISMLSDEQIKQIKNGNS